MLLRLPTENLSLRVVGDKGRVSVVGEDATEWDVPGVDRPAAAGGDGASSNGARPAAATWGTTATGHVRQYTDFRDAVRTGRPPAVTGADGRNAVEIVTAAYEASRTRSSRFILVLVRRRDSLMNDSSNGAIRCSASSHVTRGGRGR